jgi:hypothetical protein
LPACLGFVAGAVFWHFVGFWDFIGRVVLDGSGHGAEQHASVPAEQSPPAYRLTGGSTTVPGCARLMLDRSDGHIALAECQHRAEQATATSSEAAPRGDLMNAGVLPEAAAMPLGIADIEPDR